VCSWAQALGVTGAVQERAVQKTCASVLVTSHERRRNGCVPTPVPDLVRPPRPHLSLSWGSAQVLALRALCRLAALTPGLAAAHHCTIAAVLDQCGEALAGGPVRSQARVPLSVSVQARLIQASGRAVAHTTYEAASRSCVTCMDVYMVTASRCAV
jgi:hypothetical protein